MNVWKLLAALALIVCFGFSFPYYLSWSGVIPAIKPNSFFVLLTVLIGLSTKIIINDLIAGQFLYHKNGYDMCVMTFGAVLSNASMQALSDHDMFPGVSNGAFGGLFSFSDAVQGRKAMLFAFLMLSLAMTLLTAYFSKVINDSSTKGKSLLSLVNFMIGGALLGGYLLMTIEKA